MSFSFSITTYREFRTLIWSVCNLLLEKIPKQIHKSERKKITIKIGVAFSGAFRFFPENWNSRVKVPNLHGTRRVWTELMGPFMNLQGEWSSLSLSLSPSLSPYVYIQTMEWRFFHKVRHCIIVYKTETGSEYPLRKARQLAIRCWH